MVWGPSGRAASVSHCEGAARRGGCAAGGGAAAGRAGGDSRLAHLGLLTSPCEFPLENQWTRVPKSGVTI